MGKFIRSLLVILLTSVGMVAAPALAARPTKSECNKSCSGFMSELAGSSTESRRLTKKQRDTAIAAIGSMNQKCRELCGFGIVMPSTLGGLQDLLVESNSSSSSGKSTKTPAPVLTPISSGPRPGATNTPNPGITLTPNPTFAATAVPTLTVTAIASRTATAIPSQTVTVPPTLTPTAIPSLAVTPPPSFTSAPVPAVTGIPNDGPDYLT